MPFTHADHVPVTFLPSPPMATQRGATLPSLFARDACNDILLSDAPSASFGSHLPDDHVALKPISPHTEKDLQLPPIQEMVTSPTYNRTRSPSFRVATQAHTPSWLLPCSPVPSSHNLAHRKSSIASLLNSDSDDEYHASDQSLKRASPHHSPLFAKKRKYQSQPPLSTPSPPPSTATSDHRRLAKGLRHFSKQVCDKVAERGVTTYNEVADELAADIQGSTNEDEKCGYDQKNIRRRVYDALNVLTAMNIIAKNKKEIRWLGIPAEFQCDPNATLREQIAQEEERLAQQQASIQATRASIGRAVKRFLVLQQLIQHNRHQRQNQQPLPQPQERIEPPFFVVRCDKEDSIQVAPDGRQAVITTPKVGDNDHAFAVHQDADVLSYLGFNHMSVHQVILWLPQQAWRQYLSLQPLEGTMCRVEAAIDSAAA